MIRSIQAWRSGNPAAWVAAQEACARYLESARSQFPPGLSRFIDSYTFHDDRFSSAEILDDLPTGREALVTVKIFEDDQGDSGSLVVLHFIGVQGRFTMPPMKSDILFFDAESTGHSRFRMTFAVDGRRPWSVTFGDLRFEQYSYWKK